MCGAVCYEADGTPYNATICHCTMCRRSTGAPLVAGFSVKRADFRFTAGEPVGYQSSTHGVRRFCGRCGTQLTFETDQLPDEIDILSGSLDDPEKVPPTDHVHDGTRISWMKIDDGLPRYRTMRTV